MVYCILYMCCMNVSVCGTVSDTLQVHFCLHGKFSIFSYSSQPIDRFFMLYENVRLREKDKERNRNRNHRQHSTFKCGALKCDITCIVQITYYIYTLMHLMIRSFHIPSIFLATGNRFESNITQSVYIHQAISYYTRMYCFSVYMHELIIYFGNAKKEPIWLVSCFIRK